MLKNQGYIYYNYASIHFSESIELGKMRNFIYFLCFIFFRVTPAAYGGSQARGWMGATAAGLHHSHSSAGSGPCLQPTPQLKCWILNPLSKGRDWTCILMDTSWVCYCWVTMGTPYNRAFKQKLFLLSLQFAAWRAQFNCARIFFFFSTELGPADWSLWSWMSKLGCSCRGAGWAVCLPGTKDNPSQMRGDRTGGRRCPWCNSKLVSC